MGEGDEAERRPSGHRDPQHLTGVQVPRAANLLPQPCIKMGSVCGAVTPALADTSMTVPNEELGRGSEGTVSPPSLLPGLAAPQAPVRRGPLCGGTSVGPGTPSPPALRSWAQSRLMPLHFTVQQSHLPPRAAIAPCPALPTAGAR